MHYAECQYYSLLSAGSSKSSDDQAADVTLKLPYVVDVRFKVTFRELWERMKALAKRVWRRLVSLRTGSFAKSGN
jgi:hypothetical protein